MPSESEIAEFTQSLNQGQREITQQLAALDSEEFIADNWEKAPNPQQLTGHGSTMVLKNGRVFEQGGVNVSVVRGAHLPPSATAKRPEFTGCGFAAQGVSMVIHPRNPYVPTTHMNVRLFVVQKNAETVAWWFGGGFDLTPYYAFDEDCRHWHQVARDICESYSPDFYPRFKKWCDDYFYLPHRKEERGIGGLFFDDFNELPFAQSKAFVEDVMHGFLRAYLPIVKARKDTPYGEREREFQKYRRGRYVEFNLVYDRGTLFGLQSGGRTESILMSMPPEVRFEYRYAPEAGSKEAALAAYLQPRDWE